MSSSDTCMPISGTFDSGYGLAWTLWPVCGYAAPYAAGCNALRVVTLTMSRNFCDLCHSSPSVGSDQRGQPLFPFVDGIAFVGPERIALGAEHPVLGLWFVPPRTTVTVSASTQLSGLNNFAFVKFPRPLVCPFLPHTTRRLCKATVHQRSNVSQTLTSTAVTK